MRSLSRKTLVSSALLVALSLAWWVWDIRKKNGEVPPDAAALNTEENMGEPRETHPVLDEQVPRMSGHRLGETRLPYFSDSTDIKVLVDLARSQNRLTEFGAELASFGSREAVVALLQAILLCEGIEQEQLARTLQALQSPEASAELLEFLVNNATNPAVAVHVRDALARIATGADVIRMSQLLTSDPEQGLIHSYLLGTIARVSNADAVPQLAELCSLRSEAHTAAAIALSRIGSPESVVSLIQIIEQQLISDVNDSVVQALLSVRNKDAEALLYDTYQTTSNPLVKYASAEALLAIQAQSSVAETSE